MEKIGIFCSASENIDKMYFDSARQIGEWMGKAGAYGLQGKASVFVDYIVGDRDNVIGLPITKVKECLKQ